MSSHSLKLKYFDVYGRGEAIRYILALGDTPYEDEVIVYEKWTKWTPEKKAEFMFGALPVLEINTDGKKEILAQHIAIARYLGKKFGLDGANTIEQGKADMLVDACNEWWEEYEPICMEVLVYKHLDKKEEMFKKFIDGKYKKMMGVFNSHINEHGFLINDKPTWADIYIAEFVDRVHLQVDNKALDNYPKMKQLVEKINAIPQIAKRINERPKYEC